MFLIVIMQLIYIIYIYTRKQSNKIKMAVIEYRNIENIEIKVPVAGYGKPLVLIDDEPVYIADSYPDAVEYVEKNLL